jgi:hypothetical protein
MRASSVRSRRDESDHGGDRYEESRAPRWGLRTTYKMLATTVSFLQRSGPQDAPSIARYLIEDSPAAAHPNPRRRSGLSSANQVIITSSNLGLIERIDHLKRLTALGHEFAEEIGTPGEQRAFRDIILANPGFAWFWKHVASGSRTVGRSELIRLAAHLYPEYNEETRRTLVGVCMNYARSAGLLHEGPGGRRYAVSAHRLPEPAPPRLPELDQEVVQPSPGASSVAAGSEFSSNPLKEAGRLLGWLLADETLMGDEQLVQRVSEAFSEALRSHVGEQDYALVQLAANEATQALESLDPRMLRWAVRLVNGVLALESPLQWSPGG